MSILIDDLGWANYLLGNEVGRRNIVRAIDLVAQVPINEMSSDLVFLLAKAHRHLGVIDSAASRKALTKPFNDATQLVKRVAAERPREAARDIAHIRHARALAIVSIAPDPATDEGCRMLTSALRLARTARSEFQRLGDQGRTAKSLVLECRILEILGRLEELAEIGPIRDRAVADSVWARPAGHKYILGR